jgi:hypothetical protein
MIMFEIKVVMVMVIVPLPGICDIDDEPIGPIPAPTESIRTQKRFQHKIPYKLVRSNTLGSAL